MGEVAAFFDLDRTLIDVNSGFTWAQHELRQGNVSRLQFMRAALWTGMYHLSLIDMERAFAQAVSHYRGEPRASLDARTCAWFAREVQGRLRPKAQRTIEEHRARGHQLVILTGSSCFEARAAAQAWGFDAWLANDLHTDEQGLLTGDFVRPMCYGEGKIVYAERWAMERGVSLEDSFFYSDSLSDLPMLERVGHARVVTPDPRLKQEARRRGWPVLAW